MTADGKLPRRKPNRLRGYDYSQAGMYFVTICSEGQHCIFASVIHGNVALSPAGEIVRTTWNALPDRFPKLVLDEFVLMPNHLHGVLGFVGEGLAPPGLRTWKQASGEASPAPSSGNCAVVYRNYSLADVMGTFKSLSTISINRLLHRKGVKLWQRSYYEHIVRSGEELRKIQQYIMENPLMWSLDTENPNRDLR